MSRDPWLQPRDDGEPPRVAVVGGGVSGLATAYLLRQRLGDAVDVRVLESAHRLGGKVTTVDVAGLPVDTGPDAFLARAPELRALVASLGLADRVVAPAASGAYVWSRGRLRRLPQGSMFGIPDRLVPLLRARLLSPLGTARAGLDLVRPRTVPAAADPSVGELVRPRFGAEVFDRLVEPLLGGVHAGSADLLSARSAVPEVEAMARQGRSLFLTLRKRRAAMAAAAAGRPPAPVLVSFDGGMATLTEALAGALGDAASPATPVRAVVPTATGAEVVVDTGTLLVDEAVLATPAYVAAQLVEPRLPDTAAVLREIPYVDVANVTLAFPRAALPALPPDGTGFLVPPVEGEFLVGCTWLTSKWPGLVNDDTVLLRCLVGRHGDSRWTSMTDDVLVAEVRAGLRRMLGIVAVPAETYVQRWPAAMPQYTVGHADRLDRIDAALTQAPHLHLTGAAYRGVGLAGCVAQAAATAGRLATRLAGTAPDTTEGTRA